METTTVVEFFGLLLFGGSAGLAVALTRPKLRASIVDSSVQLVALVAVGATLGSLYLSEVANFVPCELCWFQRIAMYPVALIMPIAALRRDNGAIFYSAGLSTVGLAISLYHVQLQLFPDQSSFCEVANPCTASWVRAFGWMTIPQMSAVSFALILTISVTVILNKNQETS